MKNFKRTEKTGERKLFVLTLIGFVLVIMVTIGAFIGYNALNSCVSTKSIVDDGSSFGNFASMYMSDKSLRIPTAKIKYAFTSDIFEYKGKFFKSVRFTLDGWQYPDLGLEQDIDTDCGAVFLESEFTYEEFTNAELAVINDAKAAVIKFLNNSVDIFNEEERKDLISIIENQKFLKYTKYHGGDTSIAHPDVAATTFFLEFDKTGNNEREMVVSVKASNLYRNKVPTYIHELIHVMQCSKSDIYYRLNGTTLFNESFTEFISHYISIEAGYADQVQLTAYDDFITVVSKFVQSVGGNKALKFYFAGYDFEAANITENVEKIDLAISVSQFYRDYGDDWFLIIAFNLIN